MGKEKLREALKSAGATFDQRTKRWHIDRSHPNADKRVLDFVQSSRVSTPRPKKIASEPLKIDPITGQSQLDDDFSLDMDANLHKQLKYIALENNMNLYELVEGILNKYVKNRLH